VFQLGKGTVTQYKDRVVQAILDCLFEDSIKWPDIDERRIISERIRADFGLPNCIGVADGTLLPLAFWSSTEDYADYKGRKLLYTLTMLVVNDDQRRIWYFHGGWPGSTHADRVFRSCRIVQELQAHFQHMEYIIGIVPTVPIILWSPRSRSQWVP
jgi:hypothetical protein